jgi:hypothetical protein
MSKNTYSVPIDMPEKLLEQMLYGRPLTDAESIFINNLKDWLEDIHTKVLEENKVLKEIIDNQCECSFCVSHRELGNEEK